MVAREDGSPKRGRNGLLRTASAGARLGVRNLGVHVGVGLTLCVSVNVSGHVGMHRIVLGVDVGGHGGASARA
jgi:hypothetical protein